MTNEDIKSRSDTQKLDSSDDASHGDDHLSALKAAEERFRLAAEATSDLLYEWDVASDRLTWFGDIESSLGYASSRIPQTISGWLDLVHSEDLAKMEAAVVHHRESTKPIRYEYRVRHADGRWLDWLDRAKPVTDPASGKVIRWVGACSDITARKRAEQRRREVERRALQGQKLESLGVMAGGIAHEFNNMLMVISSNASSMLEEIPRDTEMREKTEDIAEASKRLSELTLQMVAYAGIGRHLIRTNDIGEIISGMTELIKATISKKCELTIDQAPEPLWVDADAEQLRQMVLILVTNAAEALGYDGGKLRVNTYVQHEILDAAINWAENTTPSAAERYAVLEVSDSGMGMKANNAERAFEPFYTTKFPGRGLGLPAALGIVRGHGGGIESTTEFGQGSTFRVYLPFATTIPKPETPTKTSTTPQVHTRTVMIVDDEPSVVRVLRKSVESLGYRTICASDGIEAVERFKDRHAEIGCIFLDLNMPRMDGEETLRTIRSMGYEVPIYLCSGYDASSALTRCSPEDFNGVIRKPHTDDELAKTLKEVMG